jgi:cell division protease FtsH
MVKDELEKKMAVLLGGRAAEHIIFNHLAPARPDDLNKVTEIARSMVTRFAMEPRAGHVTYDNEPMGMLGPGWAMTRRDYSDETAREIDAAIRRIVEQAFTRARSIWTATGPSWKEAARLLLEKESLAEAELGPLFARVIKDNGVPAKPVFASSPVA